MNMSGKQITSNGPAKIAEQSPKPEPLPSMDKLKARWKQQVGATRDEANKQVNRFFEKHMSQGRP